MSVLGPCQTVTCHKPMEGTVPVPTDITFQGIDHSDAIEARIRTRIGRLEAMSSDMHKCHVWVRAPHKKHKATQYIIDLSIEMPGNTLAISRHPGDDTAHTDIYVAIRDAFNAMERKLRKWNDTRKGRPEVHAQKVQGRVATRDGHKECGQIQTTDGRLIYFHRNAVQSDGFDSLQEGDAVELSIDYHDADEGPHASFVRPIKPMRFEDKPG